MVRQLAPVRRVTLSGEVAGRLSEAIRSGELPPGARLPLNASLASSRCRPHVDPRGIADPASDRHGHCSSWRWRLRRHLLISERSTVRPLGSLYHYRLRNSSRPASQSNRWPRHERQAAPMRTICTPFRRRSSNSNGASRRTIWPRWCWPTGISRSHHAGLAQSHVPGDARCRQSPVDRKQARWPRCTRAPSARPRQTSCHFRSHCRRRFARGGKRHARSPHVICLRYGRWRSIQSRWSDQMILRPTEERYSQKRRRAAKIGQWGGPHRPQPAPSARAR